MVIVGKEFPHCRPRNREGQAGRDEGRSPARPLFGNTHEGKKMKFRCICLIIADYPSAWDLITSIVCISVPSLFPPVVSQRPQHHPRRPHHLHHRRRHIHHSLETRRTTLVAIPDPFDAPLLTSSPPPAAGVHVMRRSHNIKSSRERDFSLPRTKCLSG